MSCYTFVLALFCTFAITHSAKMDGGKDDMFPTNKKFMEIAWEAAKTLNGDRSLNPGPNAMMPMKEVLRAQYQVDLEVLYGESGCRLGEVDLVNLKFANCRVMNNRRKAVYKIRYYSKSKNAWTRNVEIEVSKA